MESQLSTTETIQHSQKMRPWSLDRQTFTLGGDILRAEIRRGLLTETFEFPLRELLPVLTPYRRVPLVPLISAPLLGLFALGAGVTGWIVGGNPWWFGGAVGAALGCGAALFLVGRLLVEGCTIHRLDSGNWILRVLSGTRGPGREFIGELERRVLQSQKDPHLYQTESVFRWRRGSLYPREGSLSFVGELVRYDYVTPLVRVSFLSPIETFDANVRLHRRANREGIGLAVAGGIGALAGALLLAFGSGGGGLWLTSGLVVAAAGAVWTVLRGETCYQFLNGTGDGFAFEIPVRTLSRKEQGAARGLLDVLRDRRNLVRAAREAPVDGEPM